MSQETPKKPVTDLTPVYKDPAVLKGKAILVHDQVSGDAIRFDAQQLGVVAKDLSMYTVEGHIRGARTTSPCTPWKGTSAEPAPPRTPTS